VDARIPSALAARLDFHQAVRDELARPPDRLPSRVAERAVGRQVRKAGDRIQSLAEGGLRVEQELVIWMPKARFQYRPLSAVSFDGRILFRAIVADLVNVLLADDRIEDNADTFEHDALEDTTARYVVVSDIASFYQFVDHQYLEQRLIESTGRADSPAALRSLLDRLMRSGIGLPQNVGPSDELAELVAAPLQRRLQRAGFHTTRHNDDFRIAARDFQAARRALELLHDDARQVGLSLNDGKTRILRRETYESNLGEIESYGEDETSPGAASATAVAAALATLQDAFASKSATEKSRLDELRDARSIARSLRELTHWQRPEALPFGRHVFARYPQLSQTYCRYLRGLVEAGRGDEVVEHVDAQMRIRFTDWQTLWLIEPLLAVGDALPKRLVTWLRAIAGDSDRSPLLRARAVLALAYDAQIEPKEVLQFFDDSPEVAKPDIAAAYGAAAHAAGVASAKAQAVLDTPELRSAAALGEKGPRQWS
jgi:hypothetical protein